MAAPLLVTGGAGFIGANFILHWLRQDRGPVINLDKLTYASNPETLVDVAADPRYLFLRGDVCDRSLLSAVLEEYRPSGIVHFAAESHVDRSILGPETFIKTNVEGTFALLEAARDYFNRLSGVEHDRFRFLHVSTDEVYGTLAPDDPAFSEGTPLAPTSPYAVSKASADLLVRAWHHTFGLPTLTTNCSNNYGPFQFPEKLIPLIITHALAGKPLPVYGDGLQIRDWLFVEDHCEALVAVLDRGIPGETYNIGGSKERSNLEIIRTLCALLDELNPGSLFRPHDQLIRFVTDRPGHDRRYAVNASKIQQEVGWRPRTDFETGLRKTVNWYLEHEDWLLTVSSNNYRQWIAANYANRETTVVTQ